MGLARSDENGDAVAEAIREMNARLGLPSGLAELGVTGAMVERIVDGAMGRPLQQDQPRCDREDYVRCSKRRCEARPQARG
jgi:alcohol dehydrogenase class IV